MANGDVVDASIKGTKGRRSSPRAERLLGGDVSRIRVVGREERTYAEQAQYRFLLFSLMIARHVPLFVNIVWVPENSQAIECDEEIDLSCDYAYQILEPLNNSQKEVVAAMVSTAPCDSLVIAHGIHLQPSPAHADGYLIVQGLPEQGRRQQLPELQIYGHVIDYLVELLRNRTSV
jgi:hypothetical protein